jgi:hypothetical protein
MPRSIAPGKAQSFEGLNCNLASIANKLQTITLRPRLWKNKCKILHKNTNSVTLAFSAEKKPL